MMMKVFHLKINWILKEMEKKKIIEVLVVEVDQEVYRVNQIMKLIITLKK